MVAEPDPVADVLAPVVEQVVRLEVVDHRLVDVGAGDAGAERVEGRLLGGDRVVEQPSHLVGRGADDHRPLELGVVAPDRRSRLGDEDLARLERDVVGDRVGPGAPLPDLAAIARRGAVRRRELPAVARPERLEHGERGLVPGAQPCLVPRSSRARCTPAAAGGRARTSARSRGSAPPRLRSSAPSGSRSVARAASRWRRAPRSATGPW